MSLKVIIFDLDGTLLDTLEDLAETCNLVLAECGYPGHGVEAYKYFVGDGLRVLMERITPDDVSEAGLDHCCDLFDQRYAQLWDKRSRPYPGVPAMLRELAQTGVQLAVLSNKPDHFTRTCVDSFFPEQHFSVVFGQREGVEKKPDPAGALEIARLLNAHPAECVYVGDTSVDMQTGKAAGMFTIGVLWGFRDIDELQRNNADMIIKRPMEIVEYVVSAG